MSDRSNKATPEGTEWLPAGRYEVSDNRALATARGGDSTTFEVLAARYRGEIQRHCYRMLGSFADAEDAVQETMVAAWRALDQFEGRSSIQTWLFRIATNVCLRMVEQRPKRLLTADAFPPLQRGAELGDPVTDIEWIEPWPQREVADPAELVERREDVELAFVAALQHLPAAQRAALILRDVLAFSAAEVADLLDTTVVSVNSSLQRARTAVAKRVPARTQHDELTELGTVAVEHLVKRFVAAWESADIDVLVEMMVEDARFAMPPLPAWFDGREAIAGFFVDRMFAVPWRLVPVAANGQLAFACYQGEALRLGAVNVLTLRDRAISRIDAFLDPEVHRTFGVADTLN